MILAVIVASAGGTTLPGWEEANGTHANNWPQLVPLILLVLVFAVLAVIFKRMK